MLPFGQGRSYGDSCLNDGGMVLGTAALDRFIAFDAARGVLRLEAGVTLDKLLALTVPKGWFLPVTPGTQFVSIGGAIANDIHGKNHHLAGCFGNHVLCFELLRSSGERLVCSAGENAELYRATIGGLGLTGLITWAEVQLLPISGPYIATDNVALGNLDDFFAVSAASSGFTYTVAWIDSLARGAHLGRGIFFRGNHAEEVAAPRGEPLMQRLRFVVPVDFPAAVLRRSTIRGFNALYRAVQVRGTGPGRVHYRPFFYPLDSVAAWNRVYGRRGLVQYQCVVTGQDAVARLLERISYDSTGSFLTVLKVFGDVRSPGMLSFPRPGITLALDFPFEGEETLALCRALDDIVHNAQGALYPAKDARMSPAMFEHSYPMWREFSRYVDPRFSSSFWRRVRS